MDFSEDKVGLDSGYSETSIEDHAHLCGKCGLYWRCNDEVCENEKFNMRYWSELDDPICRGEEFSP